MLGPISRREEIQQVIRKYPEFLQKCSICPVFRVLTEFFAGQAFESNGRVSVTVMDGEEMVGRMADQVHFLILCLVDIHIDIGRCSRWGR